VVLGDPGLIKATTSAGIANKRLTLNSLLLLDGRSAGLLGLGEERLNIGLVDEVRDTTKYRGQDEVEEDAAGACCRQYLLTRAKYSPQIGACYSHLGIKDAGGRIDNVNQTIVGLDLEDTVVLVGDDTNDLEPGLLGMHVKDKGEGQRLLLAGSDGGVVTDSAQVAKDCIVGGGVGLELFCVEELAAHKGDNDGRLLIVGDVDDSLGGTAVDELDTKDVRLGESCDDVSLELDLGRAGSVVIERLWHYQRADVSVTNLIGLSAPREHKDKYDMHRIAVARRSRGKDLQKQQPARRQRQHAKPMRPRQST